MSTTKQRQPLPELTNIRSASEEEGAANTKQEKHEFDRTLWTRIWQGVAVASIVVNIIAMALNGGIVILAGIIALVIGPVVVYFQFQIQENDTLRMIQNDLRKDVNRFQAENNKLSETVTSLGPQVTSLKGKESELDAISKQQGVDVDTLFGLVKENQVTLDELREATKRDTVQTLFSAIIESDMDETGSFSDQEIQILEFRMSNVPGVKVNHERLMEIVKGSDRKLASVLDLAHQINQNDIPAELRVFSFDESNMV